MREITMPKLSDTMTEGTVVVWRKTVDSPIERGEAVAEIETDKATMELEAFASGVLSEIRVAPGQTVPVGTVVGIIRAAGEPSESKDVAARATAPLQTPMQPDAPPPHQPAAHVVRRRAQELGIDLATVTGTGGRIMLENLVPPATERPAAVAAAGHSASVPAEARAAAQPLSRMRAAIARTVSDSWKTIPHFSVTVDVGMDAAEAFKRQHQAAGTAVSLTALLVRATAMAGA